MASEPSPISGAIARDASSAASGWARRAVASTV